MPDILTVAPFPSLIGLAKPVEAERELATHAAGGDGVIDPRRTERSGLLPAGQFWLPEEPADIRPGFYRIDDEGGVSIDLLGERNWYRGRGLEVLHGDVEGTPVSLFGCNRLAARGGRNGWSTERWWVWSAVEGQHFADPDAVMLQNATLRLTGLSTWLARYFYTPIASGPQISPDDLRHPSEYGDLIAHVPGATITASPNLQEPPGWNDRRWPHTLSIYSEVPLGYDDIWRRYVRPLQDLLLHVRGMPSDASFVHLSSGTQDGPLGGLTIRRHQPVLSKTTDGEYEPRPLWTVTDLDFPSSIAKWFDLDRHAQVSLMLLDQAMTEVGGWTVTRFLSAVGAAESLTRVLAEPSERIKLDDELIYWLGKLRRRQRKWVVGKLTVATRPTLESRLIELMSSVGGRPTVRIVANGHRPDGRAKWARQVAMTRNALAHGGPEAVAATESVLELERMRSALVKLVTLRICQQLGFNDAQIWDFGGRL